MYLSGTPYACEPGYYQPTEGHVDCEPCPPGKYCMYNTTVPIDCPPYHYCPLMSAYPLTCLNGTYTNDTTTNLQAAAQCESCPVGA